jgi:hypothetical protein
VARTSSARIEPQGDSYTSLSARLESGTDLRDELVPLWQFMEGEAWASLLVRPRQRLIFKITENAILKRPLTTGLEVYRLEGVRAVLDPNDRDVAHILAVTSPHACRFIPTAPVGGHHVYDELADWEYLVGGSNTFARAFVNVDPTSDEPLTLVFVMGRGSSKTTYLSAGISAWFTHRIMSLPDPHKFFGLQAVKPLRIQNVATSSAQAGEFFDSYTSIVQSVDWFEGRMGEPTLGKIGFGRLKPPKKLAAGKVDTRKRLPALEAERSSSNSRSGRGRDTVGYFHDEIAFADKTAGPRSDKKLYVAIRKAVKTRAHGKGLVGVVSSPAEADGVLFDLFSRAERGLLENSIVLQVATWEMVPGQTKDTYAAEFRDDDDVALMEYGAQFYSGAASLLPNVYQRIPELVRQYQLTLNHTRPCAFLPMADKDEDRAYVKKERRFPRVIHVDTNEHADRMVLVMGHVRNRRVVIDLVRAWEGEVSYSRTLYPFIKMLSERFSIDRVTFDQAQSVQLIQDLQDLGINALKTAFTVAYNNDMARNFKTCINEGVIALYAVDKDLDQAYDAIMNRDGWDQDPTLYPFMSMLLLHREMAAAKKIVKGSNISAEAPTAGPIQTDDALDAAMACVYQAIELNGGLGEFLTLAGNPDSLKRPVTLKDGTVVPGDPLPESRADLDRPPNFRDVHCAHHGGYVTVDIGPGTEAIQRCPTCAKPIQVRLF